jgi:predicted RNA-binding Zn-ribbon protein involved in translation (DUF1610 family)
MICKIVEEVLHIRCDNCRVKLNTTYVRERELVNLLSSARAQGWQLYKEADETWSHYCPNCKEGVA